MRRAFESLAAFLLLVAGIAGGYALGWRNGRSSGREEPAAGFSQAAADGYEEGCGKAMEGRPETGPRRASYARLPTPGRVATSLATENDFVLSRGTRLLTAAFAGEPFCATFRPLLAGVDEH